MGEPNIPYMKRGRGEAVKRRVNDRVERCGGRENGQEGKYRGFASTQYRRWGGGRRPW
jgi:hypothetical protein